MHIQKTKIIYLICFAFMLNSYGCKDSTPTTEAYFNPAAEENGTSESFFAFPFPADHRRTDDGNIDMLNFPNPTAYDLLSGYIEKTNTLDGFSTNGGVYIRFHSELDTSSWPTDGSAFMEDDAPFAIVDITEGSNEYGTRRPFRWQWWGPEDEGKYVPTNLLGVAPAWGFPLREQRTYALIVLDDIKGIESERVKAPALLKALLEDRSTAPNLDPQVDDDLYQSMRSQYDPLRTWLTSEEIDTDRIVAATVFTTQSITSDLEAIYDQLQTTDAPALEEESWQQLDGDDYYESESFQWNSTDTVEYYILEGRYEAPNYQEGDAPYANEGGALHFVNGEPEPDHTETIRFVLTIPAEAPSDELGCYPIVQYEHGTTGSAYTQVRTTAGRLAAKGMAMIAIDQPFHGFRGEGLDLDDNELNLYSFNPFNIDSFRSIFRQAAIDTFSLTRFVMNSLYVPESISPSGEEITFCPDRMGFFGHSQGGLSGSMAAPFEANIDHWVISGAGGGVVITLFERKDFYDFEALIKTLLQIETSEDFSELHPVSTLVQTLADISDPINYSPYWNIEAEGRNPASVMMTSGEHDEATPYRTATTLALAGHLPITEPVVIDIPEYDWLGIEPATSPMSGNVNGATLGFLQFTNDIEEEESYDTHGLIFNRPEAINASMRFFETALFDGLAIIERDANADAR